MTICHRSGKLPIEGLCDAHLTTEYFDIDALPTEMCDLHYMGPICAYEVNSIAAPECPFQYVGVCELPIVEHESLFQGSTIPVEQPDGTILYITPRASHICQHDATFFLDPNYPIILAAQQAEIEERIRQAQLLAEQQGLEQLQ
jgi:penicillin-binding protein 1A